MPGRPRPERVGSLIQEELSQLFVRGLKDPRVRFPTITHVEVSGDLQHATVYVASHGTDRDRLDCLEGLVSARGYLRSELARHMTMKRIPELHFQLDTHFDTSMRVVGMIEGLPDKDEDKT